MVKRAKIGTSKHIRSAPRFRCGMDDQWHARGVGRTDYRDVLRNIIEYAGQYKGIGDWRPGGKHRARMGYIG